MQMMSTRDQNNKLSALNAVLKGISDDGGLYAPSSFPAVTLNDIRRYTALSYPETAAEILSRYFTELSESELLKIAVQSYAHYSDPQTVPVRRLDEREYIMELFHGPTLAFKDMALQVLPRLMRAALAIYGASKDILILVATSGDTGKAALEGFKNVDHTAIVVFYPEDGVSEMQKLQMVTQEGDNTHVAAVKGNFDDAQTGVKKMFTDPAFIRKLNAKGYMLSSANSINFGRLAPQIVYYIHAYAWLVKNNAIKLGEPVNFAVPTGNFGNILAAYYAKRMGLPVNKLICASNRNNVLTDFFDTGKYKKDRAFHKTMSPSMDILISSNLERLLFEITGRDVRRVNDFMRLLIDNGEYTVSPKEKKALENDFYAGWCSEADTLSAIKRLFNEKGYLADPHTAVAQHVFMQYADTVKDGFKTVVIATASPYKFSADVLRALNIQTKGGTPLELARKLHEATKIPLPKSIAALKHKSIRHRVCTDIGDMPKAVLKWTGA